MRTRTYAILAGCALLLTLTGSISFAAGSDSAIGQGVGAKQSMFVPTPQHYRSSVKTWLKSVKPAAGPIKTVSSIEKREYWSQTVSRQRRGSALSE